MLKIDWLSFTFKPTEDDIATYKDLFTAFLAYFPEFDSIMEECVVFGSGRGRYFDNCVAWSDNILISWDNENTSQECNGLKAWEHGINVCIPSHGLCKIFSMLSLPVPKVDYIYNEYKQIYSILKQRHCKISRLDLAFDDFTKTFTPRDFLNAWLNDEIQSPCKKFKWCEAGKGGGQTFYLGARANKLFRIYDKSKESHGEIDSIRYEIELHNIYANDVSEMILNDNFDFIQYFEKYFCVMKKQKEGCQHVEKRYNSRLENSEEWENWKKSSFANSSNEIVFPKHERSVSIEKTYFWINNQVLPSLVKYIKVIGYAAFLEHIGSVSLSPHDNFMVSDALRIARENSKVHFREPFASTDIMAMCAANIEKAF